MFMGTLFLTKEARIYNGAKIASSINGAGKTGWLHVRDVTFLLLFFFNFFSFIFISWRLISLQYCSGSVIHGHESAVELHVFSVM